MNYSNVIIFFVILIQVKAQQCNRQCVPRKCGSLPFKDGKTTFPKLFNISYIQEKTQNYDYFRVYLKETKHKGLGVFARRKIQANRTIMFYKLKVFDRNTYIPVSDKKYSFSVYASEDSYERISGLIADIYFRTNQKPKARIPFWVIIFSLLDNIIW